MPADTAAPALPRRAARPFVQGLLAPLHGARLVFTDPELRDAALLPAALLASFCVVVTLFTSWPGLGWVRRFYQVFVALAPVPTVLLASHYAQLAVLAHRREGAAEVAPHVEPLGNGLTRLVMQAILAAIALLPLTIVLHLLPLLGSLTAKAVLGLWALHWIVVNALDGARVLRPGETLEQVDARSESAPRPWFVRHLEQLAPRLGPLERPLTSFAGFCDWLAKPWREEIAFVEEHPALAAGFALTTALLLCTPLLQLFFRAVVTVAAVRLRRLAA